MARTPIHPGEHLADELKALDMSAAALETYRQHPSWSESAEVVRSFLLGLTTNPEALSAANRPSQYFTTAGGSL